MYDPSNPLLSQIYQPGGVLDRASQPWGTANEKHCPKAEVDLST